jgi:hypothetical protein
LARRFERGGAPAREPRRTSAGAVRTPAKFFGYQYGIERVISYTKIAKNREAPSVIPNQKFQAMLKETFDSGKIIPRFALLCDLGVNK